MKIEHIALYCRDLENMKGFFEKYFQGVSNTIYHNPRTNLRTYILTFPDGPAWIEIMIRPEEKATTKANSIWTSFISLFR